MDRYSKYLLWLVVLLCSTSNQALLRGPWSDWSSCSSSCDGIQERTRSCFASPGESCEGQKTESRACNQDDCVTLAIILCIVLGLFVLLAFIIVIILIIRRFKAIKRNEKSTFNVNAAEDYYDRSIRSSISRPNTTLSSIASSRATIPTIIPYLPEVKEEKHPSQDFENKAYDSDSLDRVSLSGSYQEAKIHFDVETEAANETSSPPSTPKVKMMTFAGTQTQLENENENENKNENDSDDGLEVCVDIV